MMFRKRNKQSAVPAATVLEGVLVLGPEEL